MSKQEAKSRSAAPANKEFYTLQEIADKWAVSKDTVRRIFQREAGVLFIGSKLNNTINGRALIRIPVDVYRRVCSRYQRVA